MLYLSTETELITQNLRWNPLSSLDKTRYQFVNISVWLLTGFQQQ